MPTQTGSIDFTSTGGFKSYATNKYATQSTVSQMQTDISQNATDIALRATKTEASQMAQPNLAPLGSADFASVYNATTNPNGYWRYAPLASWFTQLEDGWIHVYMDNSAGTEAVNTTSFRPSRCPSVIPGQLYTILIEVRNNRSTGSESTDMYIQQTANNQFWGSGGGNIKPLNFGETYVEHSQKYADSTHLVDGTLPDELFRYNTRCAAGSVLDLELRLSLYEGEYSGPYKPYSGTQLYASQAELKVQSDRIGMVVSNSDASSSLALTADAMEYIGDHVEIKGTDGTSTVISGGKIQANSLTIGAFDSSTQNDILNDKMQVGGRNLLTGTGDWSGSRQTSGSGSSSGDTFTFSANTSLSWYSVNLSYPHMPFSDVDGQTLTLGFDYRSDDFSDTSGDHYIYINAAASATETGSRSKYRQISTSEFDGVFVPTTEWQRGSITFVLSEALFNAGSGECNYFFIQFYNHTLNSLQLRHVKLERGNKATDWTFAPEDVEASIDRLTDNVETIVPFNNSFTDTTKWYVVPNANTWTKLDDGWARCSYTNSGSSTSSTYIQPMAEDIVEAYGDGGEFTFLVELRSVTFGTTPSSGNFMYIQQMEGAQFWGNTVNSADGFASTTYITYANVSSGSYTHRFVKPVYVSRGTGTYAGMMFRYRIYLPASTTTSFEIRVSIYPGRYLGNFTEYLSVASAHSAVAASKTATNYISADATGIRIASANPATQYQRLQLNNSAAEFYDSNNKKRTGITASGMDVYDSDGTTSVANFGSTTRIGKTSASHLALGSSDIEFLDGSSANLLGIDSSGTFKFGQVESGVPYITMQGTSGTDPIYPDRTREKFEISTGGSNRTNNQSITLRSTRKWSSGDYYDYAGLNVDITQGGGASASLSSATTGGTDSNGEITIKSDSNKTKFYGRFTEAEIQDGELGTTRGVFPTYGSVVQGTVTVAANSVVEYPSNGYIDFDHTYSSAPCVVATFYSSSTGATFGGITIAVSYVSTTGFKVKMFNSTSDARSPGFFWIAIG